MSHCEVAANDSQVRPRSVDQDQRSPLDEVLREGACKICSCGPSKTKWPPTSKRISMQSARTGDGWSCAIGQARQRTLVSGVGPIKIRAPRVNDRRVDEQGRQFRFTSEIPPPYPRHTKSVAELIPWLYLQGISTGDFTAALQALLGPDAPGLSATTVVRRKEVWQDREELLTFYDFPAEHWVHLRTTNPIESTFATIRLRQRRTKGCGSREASLTMAFMLARQAERHWRRRNGSEVMVHVLAGKKFKDGVMLQETAA